MIPEERSWAMYLRLSLTDRCDLRCVYCLPEQARFAAERCDPEQLRQLAELVIEHADVTKIRLTGGEPSLVPDLVGWVRWAKTQVNEIGLTSNGVRLGDQLADLQLPVYCD